MNILFLAVAKDCTSDSVGYRRAVAKLDADRTKRQEIDSPSLRPRRRTMGRPANLLTADVATRAVDWSVGRSIGETRVIKRPPTINVITFRPQLLYRSALHVQVRPYVSRCLASGKLQRRNIQ